VAFGLLSSTRSTKYSVSGAAVIVYEICSTTACCCCRYEWIVDPKLLDRAKWVQRAVYDCTHGTLVPGKYPGRLVEMSRREFSIDIQHFIVVHNGAENCALW